MTTNDIKNVSILIETKDGEYLMTATTDEVVISVIGQFCHFFRVNKDKVGTFKVQDIKEK